jgi:hypothetical protein
MKNFIIVLFIASLWSSCSNNTSTFKTTICYYFSEEQIKKQKAEAADKGENFYHFYLAGEEFSERRLKGDAPTFKDAKKIGECYYNSAGKEIDEEGKLRFPTSISIEPDKKLSYYSGNKPMVLFGPLTKSK